jgi:cysteinyl-tRNA synthetase
MKFYNTFTRNEEDFIPIKERKAFLYTCGPTVYNYAHIGNFRAYIFEDLLRRALKYCGFEVFQVMNLTDIDDKTIKNSAAAGMKLEDYTRKFKDAFFEDIAKLRIEKAEVYPEATAHIPEMIEMIKRLEEKGCAYRGDDGSVYFSIAKFANYGKLARIDMGNQKAGARIKTDEYSKENAADFALWKAWDENDGDVYWESPWCRGRPGWHIECSAMSMKYLGPTFDIHTGGIDNVFPHHEDEIAQSESANDCKFVNYWLHCEHLLVNGQKMSKSLNNFYTLRDLMDKGFHAREIRWVLIGTHYRKKLNFTIDSCEKARKIISGFENFFKRLKYIERKKSAGDDASNICGEALRSFKAGISDDLNVSESLAAVHHLARESNKLLDAGKLGSSGAKNILDAFRDFDKIFDIFDSDAASHDEIPDKIMELMDKRQTARIAKEFSLADHMREQIQSEGWLIDDTPQGPMVFKGLNIQ